MNINAIWHPTITYGQYRNWDGGPVPAPGPLFYEGVDSFTADLLSSMSDEVLLVKEWIMQQYPSLDLFGIRHVRDWMTRAYGEDIGNRSSLLSMLHTNKGYIGLRHPVSRVNDHTDSLVMPNFQYRYMTEDLPCGLVVIRGIAELAGVNVPHIDQVIEIGRAHV